jgi:hypothetical protein
VSKDTTGRQGVPGDYDWVVVAGWFWLGGSGFEEGFELFFAVFGGDKEGFVEDGDVEETGVVPVAGGDAHLGDFALVAGEGDALLLLDAGGGGEKLFFGKRDLDHACQCTPEKSLGRGYPPAGLVFWEYLRCPSPRPKTMRC